MISFQSETGQLPALVNSSITSWIESVISNEGSLCGPICYFFCSDEYILQTNKTYLNHDYYTDIITFDYTNNNVISGDLVISLDTVATNALKFKKDFEDELSRVMIHGILHLLGYKDKTDAELTIMRRKEDEALHLLPTFL